MGQVIIRNLNDQVVKELKRKAADQNKSLEQYLRESLAALARPSKTELVERARQIRKMGKPTTIDPVELIRQGRESR